jgi:hypothetical protein
LKLNRKIDSPTILFFFERKQPSLLQLPGMKSIFVQGKNSHILPVCNIPTVYHLAEYPNGWLCEGILPER